MPDKIEGYLEVGTDDHGDVIVNLPRGMTGHIKFSPRQARDLAATLLRKAIEAEEERGMRAAEEALARKTAEAAP